MLFGSTVVFKKLFLEIVSKSWFLKKLRGYLETSL
jgi:hypothetical protein